MHKRLLVVVLAVAVGIGIGSFVVARVASEKASVQESSEHTVANIVERVKSGDYSETNPEQLALVVESLVQILDQEIVERRVLAEQLEELRSDLTDLQETLGIRVNEAFSATSNSFDAGNSALAVDGTQGNQTIGARLAAAGFMPQQIETLRRREAEMVMMQVDVDDRARREGWFNTPRYFEELNNFANTVNPIRRDLGDDAYDRYLYASGRPNRVAVANVIETSPAELAGLREGDVILSYGGVRLFDTGQLTGLRSSGVRGDLVTLEIIRDGEPMRVTMPRGPMGINAQPEILDPNTRTGR